MAGIKMYAGVSSNEIIGKSRGRRVIIPDYTCRFCPDPEEGSIKTAHKVNLYRQGPIYVENKPGLLRMKYYALLKASRDGSMPLVVRLEIDQELLRYSETENEYHLRIPISVLHSDLEVFKLHYNARYFTDDTKQLSLEEATRESLESLDDETSLNLTGSIKLDDPTTEEFRITTLH